MSIKYNTDIDTENTLCSSPKSIIKADELMLELIELQDKQDNNTITKKELIRIKTLTGNVIKLLKKGKKIKMEM